MANRFACMEESRTGSAAGRVTLPSPPTRPWPGDFLHALASSAVVQGRRCSRGGDANSTATAGGWNISLPTPSSKSQSLVVAKYMGLIIPVLLTSMESKYWIQQQHNSRDFIPVFIG